MKKITVAVCVLIGIVSLVSAEMRIWTSVKGDTIEAEYIKVIGAKVILKKSDGKQLKVPLNGLCKADQDYVAMKIPPKLKIEIDMDKDSLKLSDYDGYVRKQDSVSGSVKIKKANADKCNREFKAYFYIFGEDITSKSKLVMVKTEHSFNFKKSKETTFASAVGTVTNRDYSYGGKRGMVYHGYLVFVEDSDGEIISVEANQGLYESNVVRIKPLKQGDGFDRNFRKVKVSSGGSYRF